MGIINRIQENKMVLIAEIGVNHFDIAKMYNISNIEAAKLMIDKAKISGAHAVKFQSYKAGNLASKFAHSYWDTNEEKTRNQFELFSKYDSFDSKDYELLSNYCKETDIEFMSTPFDFDAADYLDDLVSVFKISSSDLTNIPFITYVAKKQKPIIISVGASNLDEIIEAVNSIRKYNNQFLTILHCVLEYPTPLDNVNLGRISLLKKHFNDVIVGYSDHSKPDKDYTALSGAYLLGARVIEKHFTLEKKIPGNDHYHSMDPSDVVNIIAKFESLDRLLGHNDLNYVESEENARQNARRSCVLKTDVRKGEVLTTSIVDFKRPGYGISPSSLEMYIGKKFNADFIADTIITKEMLD